MNQTIVFLTQITGRFTNKTAQANFKDIDLILNFLKTMNSRQHIMQGMEALKDPIESKSIVFSVVINKKAD
ncbi:hypothetical protein [Pararhodonellum marinum]|uniref:hypothetical protein n=1 Tax=Pararhodonellum marinum TaxID=2755358 RepID=UPI00188E7F89|nr:hypothetical protein [Pararhodonellum marinum]